MEQSLSSRITLLTRIVNYLQNHPIQRRIGLGIFLWLAALLMLVIIPSRGYPRAIVFDETYYIPMAQKYLNGIFYQEEHPPLARLLIALGQKLSYPNAPSNEVLLVEKVKEGWPKNVDISGYRLFSSIFGSFLAPLVYLILWVILEREKLAFLGGLLALFDNALLTQTRFALPESFLLTFMLTTILLFAILWKQRAQITRQTYAWWALWGLSFAAALGVKLTALFLGLLVAVYLFALLRQAAWRHAAVFLLVFGSAFLLLTVSIWQVHFALIPDLNPKDTYGISERHLQVLKGEVQVSVIERFAIQFSDAFTYLFKTHNRVPSLRLGAPDEIGSPWYQWPFGGKAISYRWETPDGETYRHVYLIGNPMTWLASLLGVMLASALVLVRLAYRIPATRYQPWINVLIALYWFYMAGIMTIDRVMYLYHYLPPMLVGLLLSVVILADLPSLPVVWRRVVTGLVVAGLLAGFLAFMPFTYYLPLTREQISQRAVWPAWQLYATGKPPGSSSSSSSSSK